MPFDSLLVPVVMSIISFSAEFKKYHGVSFLAARTVNIVKDMPSSNFLFHNSLQTYQLYIREVKLLLQFPNILNSIEKIHGVETGSRTPGTWHLHSETLFLSRTEEGPIPVRFAGQYDRNPVNLISFHASTSRKSEGALLCEFLGQYNEWNTTESPSFITILRTVSSTNKTKTASMEHVCFNNISLHEQDPCDKVENWAARNERWLQRLVRSVDKFRTSIASAFIFCLVKDQNVIPISRVLRKRTSQESASAVDPESVALSLHEDYILPVEWPQTLQCRASSISIDQPCVNLIPATTREGKPNIRNRFVALPLRERVYSTMRSISCSSPIYLLPNILHIKISQ